MATTYKLSNVRKSLISGSNEFELIVPSLEIQQGEKIGLVGESGCGKSTLLDLLAMVLSPTKVGEFVFSGSEAEVIDVADLWMKNKPSKMSDLRKHYIGYVLQTGGLLPFITVKENIILSRKLLGMPADEGVAELAENLGITEQLNKLPNTLSVGERQRVAIARALAHKPKVVIADEPTASLDRESADNVMGLFIELAEEIGSTVIVASHDIAFVEKLGVRCLAHRFERSPQNHKVESYFYDES